MASYTVKVGSGGMVGNWSWCAYDGKYGEWGMSAAKTNLVSIDGQGLYESGVPGVGIRISHTATYNFHPTGIPPFTYSTGHNGTVLFVPNFLKLEFVRTAMGVGKGDMSSFNYTTDYFIDTTYTNPTRAVFPIQGTNLKTKLEHEVFFSSCQTPKARIDVNMGRPYTGLVKQGAVSEVPFVLDVVCAGLNPTIKPPVKVYFEGNSISDGLLNLNGAGQQGVARGVGISLTSSKGVALPFSKAKAVALDWQASGPGTEMYRFAGKARYVSTGGEVVAGKADANLTYILEYN
ncbi:fimbrial protein [Pseudomonas chlororaphis]|uniref:fimbrial protein n=1 Tax=Pseudomonas chlororaphis TaxID=587753 RepID=UPI001E2B07E3|nr:fimbrial protein [Pseudomonas chlororaphis]